MRIFLTILLSLCILQLLSAERPFQTPEQQLTVVVEQIIPVSCGGATNGAIFLQVQGQAPFVFNWSNNSHEQNLNNVPAGTYSVSVTDGNAEQVILQNIIITQPPVLAVSLSFIQNITCLHPFGTLTATVTGGAPPYQFQWSNGDTGATASPLTVGSYTLVVTDANGCTKMLSSGITQNLSAPTANAGTPITVLCSNTITQLPGSGSSGSQFTTQWTAENGGMIAAGGNTLEPTVNHTGTYLLTITNNLNGCTATDATTVSSLYQAPAATVSGGTLSCAVSSVMLNAIIDTLHTSFMWQGPNNFNSSILKPTVMVAGNYLLTLTDTVTNCYNIATATVALDTVRPTATVSASGSISCSSPSVFLLAFANIGNANFTWTGPNNFMGSGPQVQVSSPGLYTLTATNPQNGCSVAKTITVTGSTTPPTVTATVSGQITCLVSQVALVGNVQPSGMQILWSGPGGFLSNNLTVSVSTPGTYTLQATNTQNGCMATTSVTVIQNKTQPDLNVASGNLSCANPSITLYANSNTPGLTFKWTGPNGFISTLQNPSVSVVGVYNVVATNPTNGCTKSASVSVSSNFTTPVVLTNTGSISCTNPIGHPTAVAITPGTTFSWTGPGGFMATGGSPSVTIPGMYTVVATNPANGCTVAIQVQVYDNTQPPIAFAGESQTLNCINTPILLSGFGSSSVGNFSYLWTTYDGNILTGATSLYPRVNAIGTYTLKVTNNQNGCMALDSVEVFQAAPVNANLGPVVHVSCNGTATGSATVIPSGGNGSYTYGWSNGQTSATATGLSAGLYTVTVSDTESCTNTISILINQPTLLVATTSATPQTTVGVNNGTATVSYSGGTAPYSVKWSTGQITSVISNLAPGTYTVTVTDSKTCSVVKTAQVNAVNCALTGSISNTPVSCFGAANGSATANINGGLNPIIYSWANGMQTKTIANLTPATYTVTSTDANGCTLVLSTQITSPDALNLNFVSQENVLCPNSKDGSLTIGVSGGALPYTYAWSNAQTTATISALSPGTYTVTVTDTKSCTKTKSGQIIITDQNPPKLILKNATASLNNVGNASVTPAMFDNGSFDAECSIASWSVNPTAFNCAQLGTHTVTLIATDVNGNSKSGTATVTIMDNIAPTLSCPANMVVGACAATVQFNFPTVTDNCSINSNQIQQTSGLPSGATFPTGKTVQIFSCTDSGGNTGICSFEIFVNQLPAGTVTPIPATCSGICDGAAVFTPVGPTPEIVRWSNGQLGNLASGLCTGNHTVTLTDSDGCSTSIPVVISSANNGSFEIFATETPATCSNSCDGNSNLMIAGGNTPFQIVWSNGQLGQAAINLCSGAYAATVTDANGCSQVQPIQIDAIDNIAPTLTCPNNIVTSYCSPIVQYNQPVVQDNCTVDLQQLSLLSGLPSGATFPQGVTTQFFLYSDAAGNDGQCSFTVTVLEDADLTVIAEDANCAGACDGIATIATAGGFPPFNIKWSNGQQGNMALNLCPGNYAATVTDAAGCTQVRQLAINEPQALSLNILQVNHDIGNAGVGSVLVNVSGGTQPYDFNWTRNGQPFSEKKDLQNATTGSYQLLVTDALGCTIFSTQISINNTVPTREIALGVALRLQPNPATDFVQLLLSEALGQAADVRLVNANGIVAKRDQLKSTDTGLEFDVRSLPAGLWFIQIQAADGRSTSQKFLLAH